MIRLFAAVTGLIAVAFLAGCNPAISSKADLSTTLEVAYPIENGAYGASDASSTSDPLTLTRSDADRGYRVPYMDDTTHQQVTSIFRFLRMPELPSSEYLLQIPDPQHNAFDYYFVAANKIDVIVFLPPFFAADVTSPADKDIPAALRGLVRVGTDVGSSYDVIDPAKTVDVFRAVMKLGWPEVVAVYRKQSESPLRDQKGR